MNHIYRVVWCKSTGTFVVASELSSSTQRMGPSGSSRVGKTARLLSIALLGASCVIHAATVHAETADDARMGDLQSLMARYEAPPKAVAVPVPMTATVGVRVTPAPATTASVHAVVARRVSTTSMHGVGSVARETVSSSSLRAGVVAITHRELPKQLAFVPPSASVPARRAAVTARATQVPPKDYGNVIGTTGDVASVAVHSSAGNHQSRSTVAIDASVKISAPVVAVASAGISPIAMEVGAGNQAGAPLSSVPIADRRKTHEGEAEKKPASSIDTDETTDRDDASNSAYALADAGLVTSSSAPLASMSNLLSGTPVRTMAVSPEAVPTVPPPAATPTGLIIGNNGVVGTTTQLLGSTTNSLFNNSDGYVANGSLRVNSANFTQGYSTLSLLGLPLLNLTPVGTLLTTTGGAVVGGTGINSHLTLVGGVTSNNYISNINNGAAGGLLGLVLPGQAPAWASQCLNVLNVLVNNCWGVNAAQDYQVLMGDGASANGSKEVVIGTGANHTLPTVDANTAFPGDGRNDPNNPTGVPTADYAARLGHSVVIGDDASGTANAQTILGAEATSSVANSVALGYKSSATRGSQANYAAFGIAAPQNSAGEVSIGAAGQERQITHVAAGSAATDAANVAQLQAVAVLADGAVRYDTDVNGNPANNVTLIGDGSGVPVGIGNLADGSVTAGSLDAINGGQLSATNKALVDYLGGTTSFDSTTGIWTGPIFPITSVAVDGSTSTGDYTNVTDAFAAVDDSVVNVNKRIDTINDGGGIKYFHSNSTLGDSTASGTDSVAAGPLAVASGVDSVAMGNGANASMDNSVALGAGSTAAVGALSGYAAYALAAPQTSLGEVNIGNRQLTGVAAGAAADDAVNVAQLESVGNQVGSIGKLAVKYDADAAGEATNTVTLTGDGSGTAVGISNLADGSVAAGSLDAINGGQLFATNKAVVDYLGGTTSFDSTTGIWTGPIFPITSVAIDGSTSTGDYTNVTDAFAAVDDSVVNVNKRIDTINNGGGIKYFHSNSTLGDSIASGTDSVAAGPLAVASGVDSVAMGNGANASMDNSVALGAGSVTVVGALTDYAAYALTAPQTSAGELNVGNRQITGVAAGAAADDAVNVAQLQSVDNQVKAVDKLAVKYDTDAAGDAINRISLVGDGSGAPVGITRLAAGAETATSTDAVNGSQLWHWSQDTTNMYSNISLYNDIQNIVPGGSVKYFSVNSTKPDASATGTDSVAVGPAAQASGTGSVAMGNGAVASADNSVAIGAGSVADRADSVSVGSAGNERQITNVAAGTQATDAVNVAQMQSTVTASQEGTVRYDSNADGSVDYHNVSLGNGTGDTTIHNVAAGTADTDAVNVNQFKTGLQQAVDWANAYTDQRFNSINERIEKMGNRANAGVASAMAMAGLPQAYEPGKSMAAVAGGTFHGESSLAIGVSTISEGGRWVYKLTGSTDSRGDAGVTVGAGIQW